MIDSVIEFTKLDIHRVYKMEAEEFFSYCDYIVAKNKKRADEIKRIQRQ